MLNISNAMMNTLFLFLLTAATSVSAQCGTGSGNNCARAVTGTNAKPAVATRRADCSSFLRVTITPSTSTQTVWETITPVTVTPATVTLTTVIATETSYETVATVTSTIEPVLPAIKRSINVKRAVTEYATAVPTYASACPGAVQYSSACSCWGVSAVTTYAPTPIKVVTSTATETATVTATVTESVTATSVIPTTSVVLVTCSGADKAFCNNQCISIKSDPNNCGGCGTVCSTGTCVNGVCSSSTESCPEVHNCQGGGNLYPACASRPAYPSGGFCLCFESYDGHRFCTDSASRACASVPQCNTHDDCEMGNICVHHGCCHGGAKICRPQGSAVCKEPNTPSRIFRRGRARRSGPDSIPEGTELGYIGEEP